MSGNKIYNGFEYTAIGWPVFPVWWTKNDTCACGRKDCLNPGKHPIGNLAPHGRNSATKDKETIANWWRRYPKANIAISTGFESGLLVLDVDPRNGGNISNLPNTLPQTPTVSTGGGGEHYYFAYPSNRIRIRSYLKGYPGIDIKSDGGYVIAPPSVHISGSQYRWIISPQEISLASCPPWLLVFAIKPNHKPGKSLIPATDHLCSGNAYGRAALRRELIELAQAPEGNRNIALNKTAFCLGKLVAKKYLELETIVNLLMSVGENIGLTAREIQSTVNSGLRAGLAEGKNV